MLDSGQSLNSEVSFPRGTERNTVTFWAEGWGRTRRQRWLTAFFPEDQGVRSPLQKQRIQNEARDPGLSQFDLQVNKDILVEGERKQIRQDVQESGYRQGVGWRENQPQACTHAHTHTSAHTQQLEFLGGREPDLPGASMPAWEAPIGEGTFSCSGPRHTERRSLGLAVEAGVIGLETSLQRVEDI